MKKNILFIIVAFALGYSQENQSNPPDEIFCYEINPEGFTKVSHTDFQNISQYYFKDSVKYAPSSTRKIKGVIEKTDSNEAIFNDIHGNKTPISIMTYIDHRITITKKVALNNSETIYIPYSMDVNVGDSIYATNYIAIFNDTCFASDIAQQNALVQGIFTIIPQNTTSIKKRPSTTIVGSTPRNRNACGQFTKNKKSKIIRY